MHNPCKSHQVKKDTNALVAPSKRKYAVSNPSKNNMHLIILKIAWKMLKYGNIHTNKYLKVKYSHNI